jgi:hypothetical protein
VKYKRKPNKNGKKWNVYMKANRTKHFFPNVQSRIEIKINPTPNFATILKGHGKHGAYFQSFKIMRQAKIEENVRSSALSKLITSYNKTTLKE